jgi:uncharacterized membrane protein YgcG
VHDAQEMVAKAMQALKSVKHVRQAAHAPNAIDDGAHFSGWNYLYDIIGLHEDARFDQLMTIKTTKSDRRVRKQSEQMQKAKTMAARGGDQSKKSRKGINGGKKSSTFMLGDQSCGSGGAS